MHAADVSGANSKTKEPAIDLKELHAKIGQLMLEKVFRKERSTRPDCSA